MDNFTYSNPTKIIFGRDTISKIGEEISKLNINRVLMLSGGGSIKTNGVYEEFKSSMNKSGIEFIEHWGVCPNPILQHAEQALKIIKENDLQAVVAIGGGSVIDEAKAVSAGYFANSIWDLYEKKEIPQKALPLFTILTISGTGSEMNGASVLTNGDKKWALISPHIYPKVSIIDPSKQAALSKELTVYGGIDAITKNDYEICR